MTPEAAQAAFSRFLRELMAALSAEDDCLEPTSSPEPGAAHSASPAEHMDTFWVDERLPLVAHVEDPLRESAHVLGPRAYAGILAEAVQAAGTPPRVRAGWLQVRSAAFWVSAWHVCLRAGQSTGSGDCLPSCPCMADAVEVEHSLSINSLERPSPVSTP